MQTLNLLGYMSVIPDTVGREISQKFMQLQGVGGYR